jgi:sarcosine oxidase subunit gamma
MSKPVSALAGARSEGFVTVEEAGLAGMITLRGDLGDKALAKAVKAATVAAMPGPRQITSGEHGQVAWMSPDELLLFVMHARVDGVLADLEAALSGVHALCVDVSDARAVFRLKGALVRDVLMKLTPTDLRTLAPGQFLRTRLAQVPAAFHMRDAETVEIICFRSVAGYMFDLLSRSALKGGELAL